MGFINVSTLLATGNIIFSNENLLLTKSEIKDKIELELSAYFGYEAYIIIKEKEEINKILIEASKQHIPSEHHHYLLLTNDDNLSEELENLYKLTNHGITEELIITKQGIFWIVSKGDTLKSDFGSKILGNKKYKSCLTSRNINTIKKISGKLENLET